MAYRIAICDDSGKDAEFVQGILNHWALQRQTDIQAEVFSSAERFLFRYAGGKDWDILLLDIEMGAMDGVTLAKRVRRDNESVQIVFITGFADYIAEGYEVSALHYLMKPVREDKLFAVLDRAAAVLQKTERFVLLPGGEPAGAESGDHHSKAKSCHGGGLCQGLRSGPGAAPAGGSGQVPY